MKKSWVWITIFIGPALIVYMIFIAYPLLSTLYYSFHTISPSGGKLVTTFSGIDNFKALLEDKIFMEKAVPNTIIWGVLGTTIEMLTSMTLAIIVYYKVRFSRLFRTAWFLPILVSGVIVGLVFRWIFNNDWGLVNTFFRAVGLDIFAVNWLGRKDTPLYVVIFVHWWSTFGYSFVLLLAGLTAVSEELIEAAYIDGATKVQVAVKVLLPIIRPTFVTVLILAFMGKMRAFNVVWVLTNGGPVHFSETVATYVQKRAFNWNSLDLGYPSAMAVVWFGVVLLSVGVLNRWLRVKLEH